MKSRFQPFGDIDFRQAAPVLISTGLSSAYGGEALAIYYHDGDTFVTILGNGFMGDDSMALGIVTPEEALIDYLRVMLINYVDELNEKK